MCVTALVLSERVEQAVMQKRFNELGAMLLSELVEKMGTQLRRLCVCDFR